MTIHFHPAATVRLLAVDSLIPHEHYDRKRALTLAEKILFEGIWSQPLLIEKSSHIILDGHQVAVVSVATSLSVILPLQAQPLNITQLT